ncbi:MAG: VWA domain-containing protein, partial [Archaeoglobaceae archaeon]|nr:VWA domain-containing protein [Archaeoglobaceae archaeon]
PQFAMKKLEDIKIGGKTPLAEGLIKAYNVLKTEIRKNRIPILVLVTDGRANVSRSGNIKEEIYKISEKIAQSDILTIVFDADDYVSLGYSREISEITNGLYFRLRDLNSENVFNIVNKIRG